MAGPGSVQVPPDSTGKVVDMVSLSVAATNVVRQVMALGGATDDSSAYAEVARGSASTGAVGVVVRPTTATVALVTGTTVTVDGTVNISAMPAIGVSIGAVAISGTAIVAGNVNISAMPTVTVTGGVAISGTAIVAGNVNISAMPTVTVTGGVAISGTATVAGVVGLTAGTAVIGDLNAISRTVQVAVGTPFTLQGISTTVQVAISTPYIIQGISTTVQVAGSLTIGGFTDAGSYTAAQANVTIMGGVFGDAYTALTTSQGGAVKITSARAIHVNLRDSAGNELSAGTATVVGQVSLGAGTAVIGDLNAISRTVQVAVGTPFTLQGISTTVQVAVGTPFTLQGISTTVATVTNITAISAGVSIAINAISAGVTIGINSISATVNVAGQVRLTPAPAVMSASRGPKCVTASTSANVTLIASPGAGANIYVTKVFCSNASGTGFAMRVGTSASIQTVVGFAASSGGGFVVDFGDMPWMLSASEAAVCSVKPNGSYGLFNVHYYVI